MNSRLHENDTLLQAQGTDGFWYAWDAGSIFSANKRIIGGWRLTYPPCGAISQDFTESLFYLVYF
ncbi:MAG: hypothetical protein OEY96_11825 [Gammaproteobacteria bacterium]|nr:hypothetical protein [Gammaproteobacteria bacterium]